MNAATHPAQVRWRVLLVAALTAVLAVLLPAGTASASGLPAAETRVGVSTLAAPDVVGVHECITAGQRPVRGPSLLQIVVGNCVAAEGAAPLIKAGTQGGETAGKAFPQSVRRGALDENPSTCVYCRMETDSPRIDHAIPKSRGGNATPDNAQTTCTWCNGSKGARDVPVNPPPGYEGGWPPPWWSIFE